MIAQFILALALLLGASSSPSLDECDVDLWSQLGPLYMKKTGLYGCRALRFTSSDAVLDARGSSGTVIY